MISSSQTADLEARFGHILQPIRDLTRNWDVDIASYLEEYLDDVSFVSFVMITRYIQEKKLKTDDC